MMMPGTEDGDRQEFEGPDPHTWGAHAELVEAGGDIRAIDQMIGLLTGPSPQTERGPARQEALAFLREYGYQAREVLARMLLDMYSVKIPEEPASPFAKAGKVRAYNPDRPASGNDRTPNTTPEPA